VSDSFLKEIGRSYIVSAFLPAAFFVSIGYFLFQGFIPLGVVKQIISSEDVSKYQWVVVFILVLWVAFYLYSANDVTVRLFEGYFIPEQFYRQKETKEAQEGWEKENLPIYTKWKNDREKMDDNVVFTDANIQLNLETVFKALAEVANVNIKKPLNISHQMPTRLGNVLRSSETYAFERYFIIDTAIWPRLLPVLPAEITKHLEEKNNLFMFLLNSSFLSCALSFLSFIFGSLGLILPANTLPKDFFYIGYQFIPAWSYLAFSIILLGFGYLLYRVAVNAAEDFSMYIRSSFDLYRTNLLRQLNWELPETLEKEKSLWLEVCKLLIGGNRFEADFSPFVRKIQCEKQTPLQKRK
jgi:hypothetical protein